VKWQYWVFQNSVFPQPVSKKLSTHDYITDSTVYAKTQKNWMGGASSQYCEMYASHMFLFLNASLSCISQNKALIVTLISIKEVSV